MIIAQQLHTAKELMADWLQLISELSLQKDKLAELASSQNECEWRQELDKAQIIKVSSNNSPYYMAGSASGRDGANPVF